MSHKQCNINRLWHNYCSDIFLVNLAQTHGYYTVLLSNMRYVISRSLLKALSQRVTPAVVDTCLTDQGQGQDMFVVHWISR